MTAPRPQLPLRVRAFAVILSLVSFGLVSAAPAEAQVVLHRGNTSDPDTLDPQKANGQWEGHIINDLFVGLTTYDAKANAIYGAAESHTVSADGLVYTFKIREGHKWSDGTPVTADDFVYAYRRINDPKTAAQYAAITYPIKNAEAVNTGKAPIEAIGAKAIDERTLEITLEHPAPYLFQMLSHYAFFPIPRHVVEKYGLKWIDKASMVSNGAYQLVDRVPNDFVHLKKNPYFYDTDQVKIDEVFFYPVAGEPAAKRFRAGELDINNDFPLPQLEWFRSNLPEQTHVDPFILTQYIAFNTTRPPFDNQDVRLALGMAIDREMITDTLLKGGQIPAYGLVPPGISGYPGTAHVGYKDIPIEQRRETARALLAKAGYGPGNPVRGTYIHQATPEAKLVSVALQGMWRQVGAEIELQQAESKVHYTNLRSQNYDLGWGGWIADFNDARNYLFLAETKSEDMNYTKYSSPDFDALLVKSDITVDAAQRQAIMVQAEQMMLDAGPMAPVYFGTSRNLVQTWVKGWEGNALDIHRTRWLSIEGRTAVVATPAAGTSVATDGSQLESESDAGWFDWFFAWMCSWFGAWCPASA